MDRTSEPTQRLPYRNAPARVSGLRSPKAVAPRRKSCYPDMNISPRPREGEGAALAQGDGETGFPHPSARRRVWEGYALTQGAWGNRVSPHPPAPGKVRAQPLRRGMGKPGFPIPLPAGGVGRATPSQEQPMFVLFVCGGAAWTAAVTGVTRSPSGRERWRACGPPPAGCCPPAAGGPWAFRQAAWPPRAGTGGMQGGEASPHPSTA